MNSESCMTADDDRWRSYGVTSGFLERKAAWLREARGLHSSSRRFFEIAGDLVALSRTNYLLASVAFFHAIPGLERALRQHYDLVDNDKARFKDMLAQAAADGFVDSRVFAGAPKFTREFAQEVKRILGKGSWSQTETFVALVPALRNQYFHGVYLLAPDYLPLTFQLRRVADGLTTIRSRP